VVKDSKEVTFPIEVPFALAQGQCYNAVNSGQYCNQIQRNVSNMMKPFCMNTVDKIKHYMVHNIVSQSITYRDCNKGIRLSLKDSSGGLSSILGVPALIRLLADELSTRDGVLRLNKL